MGKDLNKVGGPRVLMGLNLGGIVESSPITVEELAGRILAVDGHNSLYQFLASIRGRDGALLTDDQGRTTSHLNGLLNRVSSLMLQGLKLVFVFDGKPHDLKGATLQARRDRKAAAQQEYEAALAAGDMELARRKAAQAIYLTPQMVDEAKALLSGLGVPWIQAPGEGEATASALALRGEVWAVASQDFDALLFGATRLIRNLTLSGRRKVPRQDRYVVVNTEIINSAKALEKLGLDRPQLIDMALLMGTDFNSGRHGIGPKKALKLVKELSNLPNILQQKGWDLEDWQEARAIFCEPQVAAAGSYDLQWRPPDRYKVLELLCTERGFSRTRVETLLNKLKERPLVHQGAQASLGDFG